MKANKTEAIQKKTSNWHIRLLNQCNNQQFKTNNMKEEKFSRVIHAQMKSNQH